ncbi:Alpha carbonic anhydrase [Trinorchestia longiramus]|nr:Alpha carbonic anhydrase [Trinorchestia longiramus]
MQMWTLLVFLEMLAMASPQNLPGKSHYLHLLSSPNTDSEGVSHALTAVEKNLNSKNNNVQLGSASGVQKIISRNDNDSSVGDQDVGVTLQLNSTALAMRHHSSRSKREVSSNSIDEATLASRKPSRSSDASSRGLAYFLQKFIVNTIQLKEMWASLYPDFCSGNRQSPININRLTAVYSEPPVNLSFINYDIIPISQTAENNGHTLQVTSRAARVPMVEGGGLPATYSLAQFHFHWGSVSSRGSEHTIDSVRYPIELHLVHFKNEYGSLANSLGPNDDGIVVLAVLFELSTRDNPALNPIVDQISSTNGERAGPYAPSSLLPDRPTEFYIYDGSLTTPTCDEVVKFIVFRETQFISEAQVRF